MRKLLFIFLFIPFLSSAQVDTTQKSLVNWMTIEKAEELNKTTQKPILIDIYTDWCSWCKYMIKTTYSNANIAGFINNNFYPVQIDAETSDTLTFQGEKHTKVGKNNQLAVKLLSGRMSYPTTVFLSRDLKYSIPVPGYLKTTQIEPFLVYFSEDLYNSIDAILFQQLYMMAYPKNFKEELTKQPLGELIDTLGSPKWLTFNEAFEKSKTEPKKYILFSHVNWRYSCKVMEKTSFSNSVITEELEKNYYLISFDAATEETISVNGKEYKSLGQGQPNELSMELFQQQFYFPSVIVLDENFQLLTVIRGFLTAEQLEPILSYFSSDTWKIVQFEEYFKTFESKIKK
ncbi:MAG: DUF255 domain-containing protein [Bacteroidales bacterium]|nr:DUF255 domain-containing protein [Bacteroidales bacterium]